MNKYCKVITLIVKKNDTIMPNWYDLQESLNSGYRIESITPFGQGVVYILTKESPLTPVQTNK